MEFHSSFQGPKHFSYISSRSIFPSTHSFSPNPPTMFASQSSFLLPNSSPSPFMTHVPTHNPTFVIRDPSSNPIYGMSTPPTRGSSLPPAFANVNPHHHIMLTQNNNISLLNALHGSPNHLPQRTMWSFTQKAVVYPHETSSSNSPSSSSSHHSLSPKSGMMMNGYSSWNTEHVTQHVTQQQKTVVKEEMNTNTADDNIIKGQWTADEDRALVSLVNELGTKKWVQVAESMKCRIGKQCRERWNNHLKPGIKKDAWTIEEDLILIRAHQEFGNKWSKIAKKLPGRSENTIKNHWNGTKRRRNSITHNRNKQYLNEGSILHAYIKRVTKAKDDEDDDEVPHNFSMDMKNNNVLNCGCDDLALLVGYSKCPHQYVMMNGNNNNFGGGGSFDYDHAMAMARVGMMNNGQEY